jgi:ribosomal RNA-processing protein 9
MATRRKSKKTSGNSSSGRKRLRKDLDLAREIDDDDIASSDDDEDDHTPSFQEDDSSEEENLEVKKVRLAREYLEKIDASDDSGDASDDDDDYDDASLDKDDTVSRKLQRDRLKQAGALEREYADKVEQSVESLLKHVVDETPSSTLSAEASARAWVERGYVTMLNGHDLSPTCVALQASGEKAVSGSKDHSVILWDIETQHKIGHLCLPWKKQSDRKKIDGSCNSKNRTLGQVLSVACSDDGRYAVVGKRGATVSVYDIRTSCDNSLVKTFTGHKGPVTCLAFRSKSLQLFSGSDDRCIRHYSLDEMMYLETLYGHQFGVTGIDCHRRERPVSVGRDRTARSWKLAEDSHLIFRGGAKVPAADAVTVIKDDWFVSGHEDGLLSLWMSDKKRAVSSVEHAHGHDSNGGNRSVVSLASIKGSDVVASGSYDGYLRFWKVQSGRKLDERSISALCTVPLHGFINGIAFGPKAKFVVATVGQEHRGGRWERVARAKNRLTIIQLEDSTPKDYNLDFESLD